MNDTNKDLTISLSIPEELLLLSLDDMQGKLVNSDATVLRFILAGAVLDELVLGNLIEIRRKEVVAWPNEPVGDPILDLAVKRFSQQGQVKKLSYWIQQLAKDFKYVREICLDRLVEIGALMKEQHHFLFAFTYNRFPTDDDRIEDRIRQRIRESLFGDEPVCPRDSVILSLIQAGKLENEVFGPDDADEARERIKSLKKQFGIGSAVTNAILEFEFSL